MNPTRVARARLLVALALGATAALALSVGAGATGTPVSPAAGSVVKTSKPQFAWTLPSTENSVSISVASAPGVTATGEFASDAIAVLESVEGFARTVTFDRAIPAGKYWWHLASRDTTNGQMTFTPATPFTIAPVIKAQPLKLQPTPGGIFVTVAWTMNSTKATVSSQLFNGARRIATHAQPAGGFQIESPMTAMYTLIVPKSVKKGTLLRVVTTIAIGSTKVTLTRSAKAA